MKKVNKKRILSLIQILRRNTNEDKHLSLSEIISKLEQEDIEVGNRKTLYNDFKILNECGYNVEYDNGYYLLDAPFNLSEIKIIQDSIYSLKNLDNKFLNNLSEKLYSFISEDEEKFLEEIKYTSKHKDKKLLQRMEDILLAIKGSKLVTVKKNDGTLVDIYPVFIHRQNDYYYFYYHYENSKKLYHFRFDNISDVSVKDKVDEINITRKEIIDKISESSNSFSKNGSTEVSFKIINNSESLKQRILDDFSNAILTKDGFSIIVDINNVFFSKVLAYGEDIKISDKEIAKKYKEYLNNVLAIYR